MAGVRTTLLAKFIKDSTTSQKSVVSAVVNVKSKRSLANWSSACLVKGKSNDYVIKYPSKYFIEVLSCYTN